MILIHLFYSLVPRAVDTPRIRLFVRAACVVLFAIVLAGAVSRGEDAPAQSPVTSGRGNVSIIHVSSGESGAADAPATETPAQPAQGGEPAPASPEATDEVAATTSGAVDVTSDAAAGAQDGAMAAAGPEAHNADTLSGEHVDHAPVAALPEPVHAVEPVTAPAQAAPASAPRETFAIERAPGVEASGVLPATVLAPGRAAGAAGVVDDFAESGRRFWQAGDFEAAEKAFTRALTANVPAEHKRGLILEMAGLYRAGGQLPKAAAVLEKFVKTYPHDRDVPLVLLDLGAVYRELGVYAMATSRFFQVLNSTLRVSDEDIPQYRRLAMKARLEIAETYALQGNLAEAEKYFTRLQLLDLEPADRERVLLRGAQMQFTLKQWLAAEKALATFIATSPESPHLAEVRYMRAKSLEELGRKQEAVDEVIALLQMQAPGDGDAARSCAYWKRRCANELANRFYEQGDFLGALAVYQALARASMDPAWRWPAIYQIGLCFERMEMPQRAAEAYDAIVGTAAAPQDGGKLPESLVSLQEMAKWRRSHLVWIEEAGKQLQSLSADESVGRPAG